MERKTDLRECESWKVIINFVGSKSFYIKDVQHE